MAVLPLFMDDNGAIGPFDPATLLGIWGRECSPEPNHVTERRHATGVARSEPDRVLNVQFRLTDISRPLLFF